MTHMYSFISNVLTCECHCPVHSPRLMCTRVLPGLLCLQRVGLCCSHPLTGDKSLLSKELDVYITIICQSLQARLDGLICYCSIN